MIINEWGPEFSEQFGHHFPETYMCIDTEFAGSDAAADLIVAISHAIIDNGREVDSQTLVLDWTSHPGVDKDRLRHKLATAAKHVPNWRYTWEYIRDHGMDPVKALNFYAELFAVWRKRDLAFALHNGITADERMLRGNFSRFLSRSFEFPGNAYFDTGAIYKATQIVQSTSPDIAMYRMTAYPLAGDTLKTYFQRVIHTPIRSVLWSLSHAVASYKLLERNHVDGSMLHTADFDRQCVHWLMEEFRSRISRSNVVENPFSSPAAAQRAFDQEMAKSRELAMAPKPVVVPAPRPPLRRQRSV